MKAALREKKVFAALTDSDVGSDVTDETFSLIISVLEDNPLRALKSCTTAKDAWENLQLRYVVQTLDKRVRCTERPFESEIQERTANE